MSIKNTILGFLNFEPMTGYDLKKVMQDLPFMHWSGNNNQIYKALGELSEEGCVTSEVHTQTNAPAKKVYTITEKGQAALKGWILSRAELPESKKLFLVQLAWADQLTQDELLQMLSQYEAIIKEQIKEGENSMTTEGFSPGRTPREKKIWELINENVRDSYINELHWIEKVKKEIDGKATETSQEEKRVIEVVIDREDKKSEVVEEELMRLVNHSMNLAAVFEAQENLQIKFKQMITGFDREVGIKPEEIEKIVKKS